MARDQDSEQLSQESSARSTSGRALPTGATCQIEPNAPHGSFAFTRLLQFAAHTCSGKAAVPL
jgi:hypothetical protein